MPRTPHRRPLSSVSHGAAAVASLGATAALYVAAGIGSLDLALPALGALAALAALLGWEDNRPGVLFVVALALACFPVSGIFVAISHAVLFREARVRERLDRRMEGLAGPRPARGAPVQGGPGSHPPPPPAP